MKRKIVISSQYKKDIKLARRRNLPEEELNEIVLSLANDIPLPAKNQTENFILQNLVFPCGVFWNHEKRSYRTPERGVVFDIIDSVSGRYKRETEAGESVSVSMSGYCDSNTGPSGPKPDALANCATPRIFAVPRLHGLIPS